MQKNTQRKYEKNVLITVYVAYFCVSITTGALTLQTDTANDEIRGGGRGEAHSNNNSPKGLKDHMSQEVC